MGVFKLPNTRGAHLGQTVENGNDGIGFQPHRHGSIQRVGSQHVLMHALRAAHRFCYGNEEVIRLLVDWRVCLQKDTTVRTNP